jgi:hypothetical protein
VLLEPTIGFDPEEKLLAVEATIPGRRRVAKSG